MPSLPAQLPDTDVAWLYADSAEPGLRSEAPRAARQSPTWIVVTQGLLLIAMLALGFGLGTMSRRTGEVPEAAGASRPAVLAGKVLYGTSGGTQFPDEGAVVLVLPVAQRPAADEKLAGEGLRPGDLPPDPKHVSLERLRILGGAYARADAQGEFRVTLPRGGKYHVLIVSHHGTRRAQTVPNKSDLAQLGRYVTRASEFLGEQRYRWRLEELAGQRRIEEILPY